MGDDSNAQVVYLNTDQAVKKRISKKSSQKESGKNIVNNNKVLQKLY